MAQAIVDHVRDQLPTDILVEDTSRSSGGAKLENIFEQFRITTRHLSSTYPPYKILVLVVGGICNLTHIERTQYGRQIIFKITEFGIKIQNIKTQVQAIANFCIDRHVKLVICTITPVDLKDAREHYIKTSKLRRPKTKEEEEK